MSLQKEIFLLSLVIAAACTADQPSGESQTSPTVLPIEQTSEGHDFPWLVTLPADACTPSDLIFAVESGHLYGFDVDINGETVNENYIITANGLTVEFKKPESDIVEKVSVGENFGILTALEGEPKPIAKIIRISGNLIIFQGCQ